MSTVPTSQTLGARQMGLYLTERGIDPKSIPPEAMRELIELAGATLDLTELRSSQAMVNYMNLLKSYSAVIVDYGKAPAQQPNASDKAVSDILKKYEVKIARK